MLYAFRIKLESVVLYLENVLHFSAQFGGRLKIHFYPIQDADCHWMKTSFCPEIVFKVVSIFYLYFTIKVPKNLPF